MDNMLQIKIHPKKGRCVHAKCFIPEGTAIVTEHVIPITYDKIKGSELSDYSMWWNNEYDCICLGFCQMLNHGPNEENRNVSLVRDIKNRSITLYASKDIQPDQELLCEYDCDLWFDPI